MYIHHMKQLLVPTDFSESAHNAFEYALHFAEKIEASITLLHTYPEEPQIRDYEAPPIIDLLHEKKVDKALEEFDTYGREALVASKKEIELSYIIEEGKIASSIAHHSEKFDMVIMGTKGIESEEEKDYGSEARRAIEAASCPVLVIPFPNAFHPIHHITYATSYQSEEIPQIGRLLEWVHLLDAKLSIVHINTSNDHKYEHSYSRIEQPFSIDGKMQTIGWYELTHDDVIAGLQTFAHEEKSDWLVMTTHERDFIASLFGNSVTEEMSLYTLTPLLALHAQA